ncbi:uncharacterized protein CTRU02_215474 [Colletotrichum truncatum]|uniref:Uncharacterized protein n=1 Tax=Colletotrichum truncatum TaxID=5467 RepID=A0ACC3YCM4_COLTU|nr:uncharacterized protein CTRU02_05583 [Colletotrichum truncatum]KAF6794026.1 hypothetical protein CTRU02_05583 [Colletotrichum truncatum]
MATSRGRKDRLLPSDGWPQIPTDIDFEVGALGGRTHAMDTLAGNIQFQKTPVSKEKRLEELTREVGRLRHELDYWRSLANRRSSLMTSLDTIAQQLIGIVDSFDRETKMSHTEWMQEAEIGVGRRLFPKGDRCDGPAPGQNIRQGPNEEIPESITFAPVRTSDKQYDFQIVDAKNNKIMSIPGRSRHNWL